MPIFFPSENFEFRVCFLRFFNHPPVVIGTRSIDRLNEAELYVMGPDATEVSFATIALIDDIRQLNDRIIECVYVDNHWIFVRLRNDHRNPIGYRALGNNLLSILLVL